MWEEVTRDRLKEFKNIPILEKPELKAAARLTAEDKNRADAGYRNVIARLRNIFIRISQKYNTSDYHVAVGTKCGISADLVRKIISPQNKKGHKALTPITLGCLCVGLKLSDEECSYLFEEYGMPLVFGKSLFVSITMCAIRDRDCIEDYIGELKAYKVPGAERLRDIKDI